MGAIATKVFKSGNSAAVRLPAELEVPIGTEVTVERVGGKIVIQPVDDPEEHRRRMRALVEEIEAIWKEAPYHEIEERAPIEFPERPGL